MLWVSSVVRGAESGLARGLIAEGLGEATLEVLVVGCEARGVFVGGEQVGLQGGHARCRADGVVVRRLCLRGRELFDQVGMAVEEGPVDEGLLRDAGGGDLGAAAAASARAATTRSRRRVVSALLPTIAAAVRVAGELQTPTGVFG